MKKIKITVKDPDNLEFYINESANKGDYICIRDIINIDIKEVQDFFNENVIKFKKQLEEQITKEQRKNWENEFKSSEEYLQLKQSEEQWKEKISKAKEITKIDLEKQYELEISKLKNQLTNIEMKKEKELSEKYNNQINELKIELSKKESEKENEKLKLREQMKNEHEKVIKDYETKIQILERSKRGNSKLIGEEFEIWINNKINENFSFDNDVKIEKITKSVDVGENNKQKADFLFKVLKDNETVGTVTIEAKTKAEDTLTNKKNKDHFAKLHKAYIANKSSFCILVTELEPDDEFCIKPIKEYENMYMVRPEYINVMLSLTKIIILKQATINKTDISFKRKERILQDFDDFKNSILNNSIKNIKGNVDKIIKKSEDIRKWADDIGEEAQKIIDKHLSTVEKRINDFNIYKKVIKEIENSNFDTEDSLKITEEIKNYK